MHTKGQHLILDVWLDQAITDDTVNALAGRIEKLFTIVGRCQHKFVPQGLTLVYILAESHFTIHTYPEHQFLSMDLYICNEAINLKEVAELLLKEVKVASFNFQVLSRGHSRQAEQHPERARPSDWAKP